MSSSSYYQSCLEPSCLAEPRVLRLKLAPPNSNPHTQNTATTTDQEEEREKGIGGWSFLQCLSSDVHSDVPIYNPPPMNRSPSFLCEKSLEMCTESLGSETGSEVADKIGDENMASLAFLSLENVGDYSHSGPELGFSSGAGRRKNIKYKRSVTFPPPLTSISGSSGVQVRPHRVEGRLVLKAVSVSSRQGYFHTERSNGRLTLRLTNHFNYEEEETEEDVHEEEAEEEDETEATEKEEADNLELEENLGKGEIGNMATSTRSISRCKERESGNKGLVCWGGEPCWVAT